MDFAELESATIGYLEEYLELTYNADDTILFESVEIEATARRTGGSEGTPFVDFEASVAFMENSPNIPSSEEIGQTISEALSGRNLATYLFTLAQRLSAGSPFLTTTLVTVYMPDAVMTGSGRVVTQSSGMSAAAIIGAASAGAVTLAIAGFVLFKAKKENSDNMSKFMKGYPGGMTVAGDTCATSTLGPTAVRPDDHHSIGTSVYTDDQSYISSFRRKNDGDDIMLNTNGRRPSAKKLPSEAVSFDRASIQHHDIEAGESYVSPPSHPRKMVNALKKASPLNNTDLKNYFKSKYKCSSPGGYSPVVENNEDRKSKSSHETSKSQDNSTGLDLPALDHESVTEEKPQKGQGRRKNRQYQPLQSDSNDNEEDEYYLEDSDEDNISSMGVDDLVRVSQSKLGTVEKGNAVPHLPDERTPSDELTEANASTENSLDEVSLH